MKNILLIGGNGYIGSRLYDFFCNISDYNIEILDCNDYTQENNQQKKSINARYQDFDKNFYSKFNIIILLGAQGSVSNSRNLNTVFDNSIINFKNLIQLLEPDQKFIYASSSSVYGKSDGIVDETKQLGVPYNYYDFGKQTIDNLAKLYFTKDYHWYGLRFGTVNGYSSNLRNDLMINSMIFNAKQNGKIFVTNKEINRPILGIDDLCKGIKKIIDFGTNLNSGIYNLNSLNSSVDSIAKIVSNKCNVPIEYIECNVQNKKIVNFKLQTKAYDFQINSKKFETIFDFKFTETIDTIVDSLLDNWNSILQFKNRLDDKYNSYKIISECRVCLQNLITLLDLKKQPLANDYHKKTTILEKYPLKLMYCENCFHVQLNTIVNPEKLFKNYVYISGTSETLKEYFYNFAFGTIIRYGQLHNYGTKKNDDPVKLKILDIACNDGSQLDSFFNMNKECGFNLTTVGVDPAENIYETISKQKKCHDIYCEFFSQNTVDKLKQKYGSFDIIIAQNVFAHIDNPHTFLNLSKQLMNSDSLLFIQTSQKNMIKNGEFDTAYHEHLSFFNTNSMNILCKNQNLLLNTVTEVPIHGDSYIFEIIKPTSTIISQTQNVKDQIYNEMQDQLYNKIFYNKYTLNCIIYKNNFHNKILEYKLNNRQVIGYGSTAKSNTLLNFSGISNEIDWIIDDNILKQNLYTPGSNILVKNSDSLKDINTNSVVVVFAWNFFEEIKNKIKKINTKVTILNINPLIEY
jgi:nucleoside-diphosphate-sugar epimerase/2-polyprenyl-3-methyl-5-hydroxy-6-metoxy-1,4-benzoquinol methylase